MIKGALEVVSEDSVAGWMYSAEIPMKGRVVLAFQGGQCIGSGEISAFRKDLLSAGLGDGYLGFEFPISRVRGGDETVFVKLDEGDLILVPLNQMRSKGNGSKAVKLKVEDLHGGLASLKWELARGAILQQDYDFLRSILQRGVFEKSLYLKTGGQKAELTDVSTQLAELFSVFARRDVKVVAHKVGSARKLAAIGTEAALSSLALVALTAGSPMPVTIREGSHLDAASLAPSDDRFSLQPQTLIFVDPRVEISLPEGFAGEGDLTCYCATPV